MENVFKKIFEGKIDGDVHNEFVKFSRGVFNDKYLIEGRRQKDKFAIKTGYEFANYLVRKCLEKINGEVDVKGVIVTTLNLNSDIKFVISNVKQFAGVKQYVIDCKVNSMDVLGLMDKYPKVFYALSFSTADCELKIKAKAPKSGKPSNKNGGEPKADFCSLKTKDVELVKDLFFDFPDFKEIKISHTVQIDSVILPQNENDPVKLRELAKKKGKIIRDIEIDGRKEKKEREFEG